MAITDVKKIKSANNWKNIQSSLVFCTRCEFKIWQFFGTGIFFKRRSFLSRIFQNILLLLIAFAASVQSITFNCRFSIQNHVPVLESVYTCEVIEILPDKDNKDDSLTLTNVIGKHPDQKSLDDVELLMIVDQNMISIPKNIETFFSNVKALDIERSNLMKISAKDLKPFPQLKVLGLYGNDLTSLEAGLFDFNSELVLIELSENKIEFIDDGLLENLDHLEYFYILNNPCISAFKDDRDEVLAFDAKLPSICPSIAGTCSRIDEDGKQNDEIILC